MPLMVQIDQWEQENYSGESLWLCELLLDIVVLPDIMAWFTIYNGAWGMRIQTLLLKIPGADGGKKYRLDLVQMLTMLHIFRLPHEGINNSNSSSSTEMQEILTKVIQTVDRYKIISLCQIMLEYMCYSLWFCLLFLVGIADELVIHDISHKIMKLHHEDKILEELWEAQNHPIFQFCPNMLVYPAIHSMLEMDNFYLSGW